MCEYVAVEYPSNYSYAMKESVSIFFEPLHTPITYIYSDGFAWYLSRVVLILLGIFCRFDFLIAVNQKNIWSVIINHNYY